MNILFVTYDFPFPTNSGGKTRAYHLIKSAAKKNKVQLFSFTRETVSGANSDAIKAIGVEHIFLTKRRKVRDIRNLISFFSPHHSLFYWLYYNKKVAREIIAVVTSRKIDVIVFESFYTALYLSPEIKKTGVKQIYGSENLEYKIYADFVNTRVPPLLRWLYRREVKKIKREEEYMIRESDTCLAVTDEEVAIMKKINSRTVKIPNGVDLLQFSFKRKTSDDHKKTLLFVGNFNYFPNGDAMRFFYEKVFSQLQGGDLELIVVGRNFAKVGLPADKRIIHHEFVADIHEMYHQADVFVSPLRVGGGTNFKILEAMASGVPVVALKMTAASIGALNGRDILLTDEDSFRKTTEDLLTNHALQQKLGKNAREFIASHYSWDAIGKEFNHVLHKTMNP